MTEAITPVPEATPATPVTPAEASNRLSALTADKVWVEKLLTKDAATTKEFHALTETVI